MELILNQLRQELGQRVELLIVDQEKRDELDQVIALNTKEINKLRNAIAALESNEEEIEVEEDEKELLIPPPTPKAEYVPPIERAKPPPEYPCGACGGEMYVSQRAMQSGKVVTLLVCGECRNERPI